ncbi:sugar-binding transcriptional regulator [Tsukamurella pseudospumae]|uniref:MarR family transcriptional regulator n=1 Tax=Tsukamurella pseudospumae TaxID=239498 RepID=A0A137YZH7_9ACTN|nr:sugar-binding domain-containing protein [Tsukamurella pseudospumae]KXO91349.1 MarR family transcriptional regulator [Tsukamurella pseudospumae]
MTPRPDSGVESRHDHRLLVRAATMYHLDGMTQAQVAERLGVSRPTAGRLVARARALGLVQVTVTVPEDLAESFHPGEERALEEAFGLVEVMIIDESDTSSSPGHAAVGRAALGRAGATQLRRRLQPGDTLGFTWGPEQLAVADALTGAARCSRVVQMDGAMSTVPYYSGADHALTRFAEHLDARAIRLTAPLYADPATVRALKRDSVVSPALTAGIHADVMLFGVGSVSTSTTLFEGAYIDAAVLDELRSLAAVGEIGGRFYDADGAELPSSLVARTLSVPLEAIRACRTSILIANDADRHESVRAALRGGYATVLVTDLATARWLIEHR